MWRAQLALACGLFASLIAHATAQVPGDPALHHHAKPAAGAVAGQGMAPNVLAMQHPHHHGHHGGGYSYGGTSINLFQGNYGGLVSGYFGPVYGGALGPYGGPWIAGGYGPIYPGAYYGALFPPPLVIPAETMYGPMAMQNFLGLGGGGGPAPVAAPPQFAQPAAPAAAGGNVGGGFGVVAGNANPPQNGPRVRVANEPTRVRASQTVGHGDEAFRRQKFHEAYQRYKDAAIVAPDMADAYFRQGFALTAMGQYDLAVKAFKRGLQFRPDWPASDFRLDTLYGDLALAKAAHRETLAQAAQNRPADGSLLYLIGVSFYFDGQPERAKPFFVRAQALETGDFTYVKVFLDEIAKRAAAQPPAAPGREI